MFICSALHPEQMSKPTLPRHNIAERSEKLRYTCFGGGSSSSLTAGTFERGTVSV